MTANLIKVPFVDLTWQHQPLKTEIEQAIGTVIERGDFILGKALAEFETDFAQVCGVGYGVGVASGTAAIALGLQALGIGVGDEVLVPANTFVATLIGVLQASAKPILVDCHLETALIDLDLAAKAITPQTKAIIPVHLYGQMVSPRQLLDFAQTYDLHVFEDAAQAHLAQREGLTAGSVGIAAAFSFYPSKNLGAFGNGGIFITSDASLAKTVKTLRNYGAPSKYFHTEIGTNSRLDTLQAAILQVKLPHIFEWNRSRNQIAQFYDRLLEPLQVEGIHPIDNQSSLGHVYHLYVIRLGEIRSRQRKEIQEALAQRGIQTGIHYPIPCHLQPAYQNLGYQKGDFPIAEILCEQILSLPMYPGLTQEQARYVIEQLSIIVGELIPWR